MIGRADEAQALFERLLSLRNDLGLLSEEYDPIAKRLVGNFPQAFSHVSLVNSACRLSGQDTLAVASDRKTERRLIDRHLALPSMSRTKRRKRAGATRNRRDLGH